MAAKNNKQIYVRSILEVIKSKKQENLLPEVTDELKKISDREKTDKKAVVWSVIPLTQGHLSQINKIVFNYTGINCNAINKIDTSLLGGFKITIGDWIMDASINCDINNIQKVLN